MTGSTEKNEDVVIVGAGPAGLMLAFELGLQGVRAVVLERRAEPRDDSPGVAINLSTAELLDQRGLLARLGDDAVPFPVAHFSLLPLELDDFSKHHLPAHQLSQPTLERMLEAAAVEHGARIRRGHELVRLEQDDTGVVVTVRTAGGEHTIRSRFVVGCDGTEGAVRESAGIGFIDADRPFYGLAAEVPVAFDGLPVELLGVHYVSTGAHFMGIPIGSDRLRVVTAEFDTEPPSDEVPVDLAEVAQRTRELTGKDLVPTGAPYWLKRYRNPTGYAESFRSGRVLLAGDAAHSHFPLNGLALNLGIEDAVNLGWKLAAEIDGWAPTGLLDSYDGERRPVGRAIVENVRAQVALSGPEEKVGPLRELLGELIRLKPVHRRLLYTITGISMRYPVTGDTPHTVQGFRLPPFTFATADGAVTAADLLRTGRGILAEFTAGEPSRIPDITQWSHRVDSVVSPTPMPEIGAVTVLIRPDGRVAWAADAADESGMRDALEDWFGLSRSPAARTTG